MDLKPLNKYVLREVHPWLTCRGDSGTVIWSKGFLQTRYRAALGWIQEAGVTVNKDKCELNNSLLGHNVGQNGIQANPQRTKAIDEMNTPRNNLN